MDAKSNSGSDSSDGTLKPIPRERAFLETYFYTIAQFQFDRAHDFVETEKEKSKQVPNCWFTLITVLMNLAHAEKQYFTMAFIEKKLFKQTIRPLYSTLLTELSKQNEVSSSIETQHGREALAVDLSKQISKFIHARLKMIGFYEFMVKSGWNHIRNINEVIKAIQEISLEYAKEFHHPILDPLKTTFTYEVDVIITLFKTEKCLAEWCFLDSLLLLRDSQSKLQAWAMLSPSTSVKEQLLSSFSYKSFFGRVNKNSHDQPFLFQWLHHLFADIYSKFSFYFYTSLSAQVPSTEIKASFAKLSIDFMSKLQNFQKKTDAVSISLVLDTTTMETIFRGHGYHLDSTIREKPTGMNSFPSVVHIPHLWPKEHWPNVISIINDQHDNLKMTDKVVYFYDKNMDSSYFLIGVDVRMTLVVLYTGKKKERDNYIQSVLTDIRASLDHDKLYLMCKPGQTKAF